MRAARKLSVVPDCPQPETPIKPVQYGAAPWSHLPPSPPAHEISIRARAQSLLSRGGKRAELPDYETALRIIAEANRPKRVTVPSPLPSGAYTDDSPSRVERVGRQSHTNTLAADTAKDWFNGPECAAILAQPVEPCTENPFVGDCEPSEIDA